LGVEGFGATGVGCVPFENEGFVHPPRCPPTFFIPASGCRVQGFGFRLRVSGFGFRVGIVGCRVSLGLRGSGLEDRGNLVIPHDGLHHVAEVLRRDQREPHFLDHPCA